jgi:hypothetical protein
LKKLTIIGVVLVAMLVFIAVAVVMYEEEDNSFSHEGKIVGATASSLLPNTESLPFSGGWGANISEDSPKLASGLYLYLGPGSYQIMVIITVYDTVEEAKDAYSALRGDTAFASDHDKCEQCFKFPLGTSGLYFVFQDMNVYGEVFSTSFFFEFQWNAILSDIENKIHNAAVPI